MSNFALHTDTSTGQRAFYGKPQHETVQVDDRDIFCTDEPREEEQSLYAESEHYRPEGPDFVYSPSDGRTVRVA
ncbi:hypothetical protein KU306_04630 [Haloferax larsenii]|uniref:Uncharacterized protein n=1 Tax=Haloferax larsenii TaxID=302484 RepID=A0ABY5RIB0_HALLR|nr:hypothetical protein [Haloferax larsenii]UVE51173.1 hypothetical protein KU306_04630 [Haloferax larsenii]